MSLKPCNNAMRNQLYALIDQRAIEEDYESDALCDLADADAALENARHAIFAAFDLVEPVRVQNVIRRAALRETFVEYCFVYAAYREPLAPGQARRYLAHPVQFDASTNEELFNTLMPRLANLLARTNLRPVYRMIANQLFVELSKHKRFWAQWADLQANLTRARELANQASEKWDVAFEKLRAELNLEKFFEPGSESEAKFHEFMQSRVANSAFQPQEVRKAA